MSRIFEEQYHGPVRLRIALANDYLAPANQALTQVGAANVWRTATQLGLLNPEIVSSKTVNALSLIRPVNILEISHAFSIFPNQGLLLGRALETATDSGNGIPRKNPVLPSIHPLTILRVEDTGGKPYWIGANPSHGRFSPRAGVSDYACFER